MLLRGLFIVIGAFFLGLAASPASAYSVHKCDEIAENDISVAADYIDRRLQRIADEFTHISKDNRDEFVRKWPRVNINCQDEGQHGKSRRCLIEVDTGGFSHGGPGNQINVCYYNSVDANLTLCGIVNTLVHESGHADGFPRFENHSRPTAKVRTEDPIYVMGDRAEALCKTDTGFITDGPLIGRSDLRLGAACRADDQCQAGRCLGGTCQCDQDVDCPSPQKCFKPAVGRNYCSNASLALNAACTRDDQCRSNQCENKTCVCRHDTDCATGQTCRTPITGANRCEAATAPIGTTTVGGACTNDQNCLSNKCDHNSCVCNSDADCAAGTECYRPIGAANLCRTVSLGLGASCQRDSQCRSGQCEGDECVCRHDDDCGSGFKCKTPITGKNRCEK